MKIALICYTNQAEKSRKKPREVRRVEKWKKARNEEKKPLQKM